MDAGEKLVQTAAEHLEAALAVEEPSERDYHIRSALQCCDSLAAETGEDPGETTG